MSKGSSKADDEPLDPKPNGNSIVDAEKAALERIGKNPKGPDLTGRQPETVLASQAAKVTAPIDFDGHIIRAEVKANGKVVGGHSTVTGEVRTIAGTESAPNAQGVYEAKIEVSDPSKPGNFLPKSNNGGVSTMFPKLWSANRIKVEVDVAFKNKTVVGNKWFGTTPSGVRVEGYLSPKTTVFPKM